VTPLDPVTLAVLNGRLVQIADEMDATLYRSAFNPIIAEAHDACHGLYHAETGATIFGVPMRSLSPSKSSMRERNGSVVPCAASEA
jgi:N-methylhydantoinase B/oxoprolinase/acetone carboxylase alpha subunit